MAAAAAIPLAEFAAANPALTANVVSQAMEFAKNNPDFVKSMIAGNSGGGLSSLLLLRRRRMFGKRSKKRSKKRYKKRSKRKLTCK